MAKTKTYKVGSEVYDIPENETQDFLSSFKDAVEVESYLVGKDTFDIPLAEIESFKVEFPNAEPLKKKVGTEPTTPKSGSGGTVSVSETQSIGSEGGLFSPMAYGEKVLKVKQSPPPTDALYEVTIGEEKKQVTKDEIVNSINNPKFLEALKSGQIGLNIQNDPEVQDLLAFNTKEFEPKPIEEVALPEEQVEELTNFYSQASLLPMPDRLKQAGNSFMKAIFQGVAPVPKSIAILSKKLDFFDEYKGKETQELATYKAGQYVDKIAKDLFPTNPEFQEEFLTTVLPSGAGSIASQIASAFVSPTAPLIVGSTSMGAPEFEQALQATGDEEKAFDAWKYNFAIGSTEAILPLQVFSKIDKATAGGIKKILKEGFNESMLEGAQEAGSQMASNYTAKQIYDANRDIMEGVAESAAAGAILGGFTNGVITTLQKKIDAPETTEKERIELKATKKVIQNQLNEFETKVKVPADEKIKSVEKDIANPSIPDDVKNILEEQVQQLEKLKASEIKANDEAQFNQALLEEAESTKKELESTLPNLSETSKEAVIAKIEEIAEATKQLEEAIKANEPTTTVSEPIQPTTTTPQEQGVEETVSESVSEVGDGTAEATTTVLDPLKDVESTAKALEGLSKKKKTAATETGTKVVGDKIVEGTDVNSETLGISQKISQGFTKAGEQSKIDKSPKALGEWLINNAQTGDRIIVDEDTYWVVERKTDKKGNTEIELQQYFKNENDVFENNPSAVKLFNSKHIGTETAKLATRDASDLFESSYRNSNGDVVVQQSKYIPASKDSKSISEAYHKAKADGSNPELVKAVEDLLGTPKEKEAQPNVEATPEVKNQENPALKDVESTAKALDGVAKKEPDVKRDGDDLILKHGTPHDFTKFQLEKIGTGEGQQAFGYGLYFTDGSKIAEQYAKKLSEDKTGLVYEVKIKGGAKKEWAEWREPLEQDVENKLYNSLTDSERKQYEDYLDKSSWDNDHVGKFDELKRDEYGFETYDKPSAVGLIYRDLKDAFGQEKATEIFKRAGVDGIKYRSSAGRGDNFNYVVFDPNSIEITKKEKPLLSGNPQKISEAYHKAKADGSNPELVKAVEQLLTPKTEQDAVQEQTAGQVPIQPEARISEEVEERTPEAKPESVTEEGKEEVTQEEIDLQQEKETQYLLNGEAQKRRSASKFIKDGIEYVRNKVNKGIRGNKGVVKFAEGVPDMPFTYKLVEAEELQPSHSQGYRNPMHFIPEAQPKNRNDEGSKSAEMGFANEPRFKELGENTNAYSGAPVVNERSEVVQGNNRAAGLKIGYNQGNGKYKNDLADNAEKFGFSKEQVLEMKNPILVREVAFSDEGAIEFGNYDAKDLETGGKRRIDPIALVKRIPIKAKAQLTALLFKDDLTLNNAIRNNEKEVLGILTPYLNTSQRTTLIKDGELSARGVQDIEAVVQQFLFDNGDMALPDLFENLSHKQKEGIRKSLPFIFSAGIDANLIPEIQNAILALNQYESSGIRLFDSWLPQADAFTDNKSPKEIYTPQEIAIARVLNDAKSQIEIVNKFKEFSVAVEGVAEKPATLLDEATPAIKGKTKEQALNEIFKIKKDEGQQEGDKRSSKKADKKTSTKEQSPDEIAKKKVDDKIQKAKDDLNKLFQEGENLGFAFDPKREAERQFNIHKTLVTLAKLYIQKGIQTAQDFANEVGLRLQDVARAWEEASGKKETTKQDLANEPYDIEAIRQGLSQRQMQLQMSQIETDAQNAIAMGATDINSFNTAMSSNAAFNALPQSAKANVYYNAISTYANSQAIQQAQQTPQIIDLKDQTWLEKLKTSFQDRLTRLKDVQKQMELAGINILDQANAALKYELLIGKAKAKIDDKFQNVVKSRSKKNPALLERLVNDGGDPDELGLYMYALHAPERNAAIAQERQDEFNNAVLELTNKIATATSQSEKTKAQNELNKLVSGQGKVRLLPDAGSGMTNQQAQEIIDAVEQSGKKDLYDNYAQQFRNEVINPTLDAQLEYGLITQEQYDAIKAKYQNYVPLQVVEKALQKRQGGSLVGGNIKGKDIFRAKGSDLYKYTERYNPLLSSLFAFNNATIRGEQNTAATAFLELAKTDTNNEIFEIHKPEYTPILDSNGDVKYLMPTTPQSLKDKSIELKVKGKPVFVEIKDAALRKAMQEQGIYRGFRGLYIINNWLRNTATIMNPEFIFTNFGRDFETALINIQSEVKELNVKGVTTQIANPKNIIKAGKGIIDDYKNNHNSEWAKVAKEYRDNGGQVSWFQKETLEEYVQDINSEIKKIKKGESIPTKVFNALGETMFLAQSTVEQSIRLSTYKALRDAGVSAERAASAAKNITVNFENKGNWSGLIDSLYLFANAGIQGSYRMARAVATSRKAQGAVGVLFVAGILEAYINDIFGGEDDDDEQINDSIKERNFVLVNPNNPKSPYFKFPLAYGANVFKHAGNLVYDVANKRKKPLDATVMLFRTIYNQFSPIQGETISQALSPTFADPIVQGMENRTFFGSPIKPEQPKYSPPKKESDLYYQSVRPISKNIATWLNNNTGGSAVEAGYIDISPEYIDHYYDAFTGGTGRFIANTGVTIKSSITREDLSLRNMPFVRSFVGDTNERRNLEFIYETLNSSSIEELSEEKLIKLERELDLAVKTGTMEEKQAKKIKTSVKKGQEKIKKYKGVYELEEEKKKKTTKPQFGLPKQKMGGLPKQKLGQ